MVVVIDDKGLLKKRIDCCDNCEFYSKFKKTLSRPVVRFSVLDRFNEYVSMDLKEVSKEKVWILYLIRTTIRYTGAFLIRRKKKGLVVSYIFQIWVTYFGAPGNFHSNCSVEFANDIFREINKKLGIEASTTRRESLFRNEEVEKKKKVSCEELMKQ